MGKRVMEMLSVPMSLGFGCFFAWQFALVSLLFPTSNDVVVSPVVVQALACCLVSAVSVFSYKKNKGSFSRRTFHLATIGSVVLGTVAAMLVSAGIATRAPWSYVCAVAIGFATGVMFYTWAEMVSRIEIERRSGTMFAGLFVSAVLSYAMGTVGAGATHLGCALLGALAIVGFAFNNAAEERPPQPPIFRPTSNNHFRLLMVAIVLYAFVFGSVSGSTAERANEETICSFNIKMSLAVLIISAVLVFLFVLFRRPVRLSTMGRVLTPVLAVLFLLHIPLGGSANGWLPSLTLGFWQLVQLFVFLVLVELAQSGYASLSFVFPLGWSFISFGFAVGAIFGQATSIIFGTTTSAVEAITVLLTIIAVIASSILAAGQYPQVQAGEVVSQDGGALASATPGAPEPAPAVDSIASVCAEFVAHYGLSDREREVLELLARGNTRASIADKLCISENTVRVHVKNIYSKLRIHSKQQLIDMVDCRVQP